MFIEGKITKQYLRNEGTTLRYYGCDDENETLIQYTINDGSKVINHEAFQDAIDSGIPIKCIRFNRTMLASIVKVFGCHIAFALNYPYIRSNKEKKIVRQKIKN